MGRPKLPVQDRRQSIVFRLPKGMVDKINEQIKRENYKGKGEWFEEKLKGCIEQ